MDIDLMIKGRNFDKCKNIEELIFLLYQPDILYQKAVVLRAIIENSEKSFDFFSDLDKKYDNINDRGAVVSGFKTEIHYSMFQIVEALFVLMFALLQKKKSMWEWVSSYTHRELYNYLNKFIESDFKEFTENSNEETILYLFFPYTEKKIVENQLTFIHNSLKKLALELKNKNEYNSYKHGIRVMSGNVTFKQGKKDEYSSLKEIGNSDCINYIYSKNIKENLQYFYALKPFDYKKSCDKMNLTWHLIRMIIFQRKAYIGRDIKQIPSIDFSTIKLEEIFSIEYPSVDIPIKFTENK